METQPFTYDSIKTNGWLNGTSLALPHGLGHGWAAVLWDMTWDLIDKHGFNREPVRRLEHGRQQPRAPVRHRRPEAAGLRPGPGRRARRDHRRRRGARPGRGRVHDLGVVRPPWPRLQRRPGHDGPQRQHGGVRHAPGLQAQLPGPGRCAEPALNDRTGGQSTVDLRFTARRLPRPGRPGREPAVLAPGRLHDAEDRQPRVRRPSRRDRSPVKALGALSVDDRGIFTFPWQTEAAWAGTCREMVATADTGRQYRAYFRFT